MTVKDLIELLKSKDPDAEVITMDGSPQGIMIVTSDHLISGYLSHPNQFYTLGEERPDNTKYDKVVAIVDTPRAYKTVKSRHISKGCKFYTNHK